MSSMNTLEMTANIQTAIDCNSKLLEENAFLNDEVQRLRKLLNESYECTAIYDSGLSDSSSFRYEQPTAANSNLNTHERVEQLEDELRSAQKQVVNLKIGRKKLKSDNKQLIDQIKVITGSLQEKEFMLRNFIRSYEMRVRESQSNISKVNVDREKERWQLLKQATDDAERSLVLAQQLTVRGIQLHRLQEERQRQILSTPPESE